MSQQPTLKSQTRKMVFDVFNYFLQENNVTYSLNKTAEATQKSLSTVKRIVKESKMGSSSDSGNAFRTPGKKRQKIKPVTGIDELHKGIIRRCIHYFHLTENELPTNRKLLNKLRSDINFQGSEKSLRSIMKSLGFKWKATEDKRRVLLEKSAIRLSRINYLRKITQYRQENRPVIYTDVVCVHATQTTPKVGTDSTSSDQNESSSKALKKTRLKGDRFVIVHAGSDTGFVHDALLTFKSGVPTGDYQGDMTFVNYEKWLRTQLLPNLPPNSVIVADNASYLNKEHESAPSAESRKDDMQGWLLEKGINFTFDMMKPQLYELIKNNKDRYKVYAIDKILKEHGHELLRLPPHHPDLNPIKMAWATIKSYVSSKNVPWNGARVIDLVKEKVNAMGPSDLKELCDKVRAIEEAYVTSDHIVDELTDELVFVHGGDSDGSESDLDYSSDESGTAGTSSGLPFESYLEVVMCDSD